MKIFKKNLHPLKLMIAVAIFSAFFISCKKETTTVTIQPTETAPVSAAFFLNGYYSIDTSGNGGNAYEWGCLFQVAKNGKILRLGAKMPKAGSYRVTLWDADSKTQLAQTMVTQSSNGIPVFSPITPVSVTTGKTYSVSIWISNTTTSFFITGGAGNIYPIKSGNITIIGNSYINTTANPIKYPGNDGYINGIVGLPDIEFMAD
jgi:hypothetical protein